MIQRINAWLKSGPARSAINCLLGGYSRNPLVDQIDTAALPVSECHTRLAAVNWPSEAQSEQGVASDYAANSIKAKTVERYIRKNTMNLLQSAEPARLTQSNGASKQVVKDEVAHSLDALGDGLKWTLIECQGNQWYVPAREISADAIFESTLGYWALRAAEDKDTPVRLLEQLAQNESAEVRIAVADNPSTPVDLLSILAADEHLDVRYAIAENHNVDQQILLKLCEDDNPYVADRSRRTLERLSTHVVTAAKFDARSIKVVSSR